MVSALLAGGRGCFRLIPLIHTYMIIHVEEVKPEETFELLDDPFVLEYQIPAVHACGNDWKGRMEGVDIIRH